MAEDTVHTEHLAATLAKRSKVAKKTAHTEDREGTTVKTRQVAKDTGSVHIGKQEQSGEGQRTHSTTHRAGTPVNRS